MAKTAAEKAREEAEQAAWVDQQSREAYGDEYDPDAFAVNRG